jgi:hypothetical protein
MRDAMAVRTENETLADLSHDRLWRSAASDGLCQTEAFGLPMVEVENPIVLQTATKTRGLFL